MLMTRASQMVTSTDLQKRTRALLDSVASGDEPHFVVMRDNKPAAVMIAAERFEALLDELEDLRIAEVVRVRAQTPESEYLSKAEMDAFLESL
jgi:antitoxin StbD